MPLAAIGAVVGEAIGGMTLAGLATGATIVGTGLQLVGMATGSKTLSKVGGFMSLAGGVGIGANAISKGIGAASAAAESSSASALLKGSNPEDVLSSSVKGSISPKDLTSSSVLKGSPGDISGYSANNSYSPPTSSIASYSPETKSTLASINDTLTRYSMPMNIMGGMGEAYMTKQMIDQRDRMQKRDIAFQQNAVDRRSQMPGQFPTYPSVSFNPNAYTGFLKGQ